LSEINKSSFKENTSQESFNPDKRIEKNTGYTLHENYDPDKRITNKDVYHNEVKIQWGNNDKSDNSFVRFESESKRDTKIVFQIKEALPRNGGKWTDKPGNSEWKPDPDVIPNNTLTNPEHKSWDEILKKYGIDSIPFKDGAPDFSEIAKGEVEIDDFSDDRASNFSQADEKLAEQRGCKPEEVAQWRKENKYTWHECKDCKTLQKVPTEVHGNVPHSGGISEYKTNHANN
jgi:hypothetical protein